MRLKVLLLGDDPVAMNIDAQFLRERGVLVFSAFNLQNLNELISEVKPDLVFFDPRKSNNSINGAYNSLISNVEYNELPVIFTLSEDDIYLVTRKRLESKDKKSLMADNMVSALKMALRSTKTYQRKTNKTASPHIAFPGISAHA